MSSSEMSVPKSGSENSGSQNPVHRTVGISRIKNDIDVEFCWIIKDFSKISSNLILSPEFDGGELSKVKWFLQLKKEKDRLVGKEFFGILLCLAEGQNVRGNDRINVHFEVNLHFNKMSDNLKTHENCEFSNIKKSWACKEIMEIQEFQDDQMKIECKITLKNPKLIHKIIGSSEYQNKDGENFEKLRSDYGEILQNKEHSDFEIKVQDETFKVHKAILSQRSKVFSAMFSITMQESINSSVKIEDFSGKIVKNMLEFIYTGKTDILESDVPDLLKIADKYDLSDLKCDCENYLIVNLLNNENCVLLLELADSLNASNLKSQAINFIIEFKNEVSQTELFQNLMKSNCQLAGEILMAEWRKNLPDSENERKRKREE